MLRNFTDQTGRQIFSDGAQRIVSLVPSMTELCAHLGLEHRVVGITRFCVQPSAWFRTKMRVGGTKDPDIGKILALEPDLVLANKEENTLETISALEKAGIPTWVSDVRTISQSLGMIEAVGVLTGMEEKATALANEIHALVNVPSEKPVDATCLIWMNPVMTVNADTFIHAMMELSGFRNVFGPVVTSRYPELSEEQLVAAAPRVLLLPSEPFPFSEKHRQHFARLLPDTAIYCVDGAFLSWYGSRMTEAIPFLRKMRSATGTD